MNVTGKTRIFRKDFDGKPSYSRRISAQEYKDGVKGDWINAYEPVQLPKDANIADKTDIEVQKGFESVFRTRQGEIRRKLVVLEYVVVSGGEVPVGFGDIEDDPF